MRSSTLESQPGTNEDPIKHVVLLMLENHSFDQMMGCLQHVYPDLEGIDPGVESPTSDVMPRFNLSLSGKNVNQIVTDELQMERDPKHELENVLAQIADGNAGFVKDYERNVKGATSQDLQYLMGYYALDRLLALHQLGANFTVCDHWFSSLPGPTWPNRFFALSGTSSGRVRMPEVSTHPRLGEFVAQDQITLFDRLNEVGKSWRVYFYDFPVSLVLNHQRQANNLANYHLIADFFNTDIHDEGTFPSFVFIEPKYMGADQNDDHPPHNVYKAEKLVADVYNAIRSNPDLWATTLLVVVYDEHGGFYDHVEPPEALPPDDHREEWTFDRLGVRVPALLVSPWVGARVEATVFDHTSLLRYLIDKWQLGPLGHRTAAAKSIRVAINQDRPREGVLPFIRVPYTYLMPTKPELEQGDISKHHRAIHLFATFFAEAEGAGTSTINEIARAARWWVRIKAWWGKILKRLARFLGSKLDAQRNKSIAATGQVVRDAVANARNAIAPPTR